MTEISNFFKENNYVVIKKFLDENLSGFLYNYCINKAKATDFKYTYDFENYNTDWDGTFGDTQISQSFSCYADVIMETLLQLSLNNMEKYVDLKLIPNYSYWRLYEHNDILEKHVDRNSCEISVTICLGYNVENVDKKIYSNYNWPMFIKDKNGNEYPVSMEPGDMIIYRGCELEHWRTNFKGLNHAQVFLHYSDVNSTNSQFLDGRPMLGISQKFAKNFIKK